MVRLALPGEAAVLHALAQRAYGHYVGRIGRRPVPMDDDYAAKVAAGHAYVVEADGDVVAFIVLVPAPDHLLVENVAVDPGRQGSGLGSGLLTFAEERARALGLLEVRLYTHVKMTENRALYARRGYREVDRRVEHGLERVFMTKTL